MKKLLVPSLLAGLMICLPTTKAKAQILYYQPYSWDTTGKNELDIWAGGGATFTEQILTTPSPAGLQSSFNFSANAPSGISSYDMLVGTGHNNSVWAWAGGGSPANYHDFSAAQQTVTTNLPTSSTPPAISSSGYVNDIWVGIWTDANGAYVDDYSFPVTGNNIYPYQDTHAVYNAPGRAYLSSESGSTAVVDLYTTGTNAQLAYTSQAAATYIVP